MTDLTLLIYLPSIDSFDIPVSKFSVMDIYGISELLSFEMKQQSNLFQWRFYRDPSTIES